MKRSKFSEEQIAYALRQVESGTPPADVFRQVGIREATLYVWKKKFAHLGASEMRRRLRGSDLTQTARAELPAQFEEVLFEDEPIHFVLIRQYLEHARQRVLFGDELPHPRRDRVQSEIRTGFQIQQHGLAVQFPEQDVVGNPDRIAQRQIHMVCIVLLPAGCPL